MSDEAKPLKAGPLPARRPGAPGAPGAGGAAKPRPVRPAGPPPVSAGSLRLRKMLMLGIIFACLGLGGMIGWRLWQKYHPVERTSIDVDDVFDKTMDVAKGASADILKAQNKVWLKDADLTADDLATIKTKLAELRDAHDKLKDLLDILRAKNMTDTGSFQKIVPKWIQLKMWIQDAADLLEHPKPPEYGGLNIPMFVTSMKIRKAQDELGVINTTKDEIIKKNDPAEIAATRKKISDLRDQFRSYFLKCQALDKYVADELARPDLTEKEVMELGMLRDDANKATMAVKAAGMILQAFPEAPAEK